MSQLSLDSLESETINHPKNKNVLLKSDQCNLKTRSSKLKQQPFYLEHNSFSTNLKKDTRPDETAVHDSFDNRGILCTGAIIAKDNIEKMLARKSTKEIHDLFSTTGRIPLRQKSPDKTVTEPRSSSRFRSRDSLTKGNLLPNTRSDEILEKNYKKLDNLFLPRTDNKPKSYLELYRRKFSVERNRGIRSPEGSILLICGDNLLERHLTDVDSRGSTFASGDDQSELSFYHRLMEENSQEPRTARSCETLNRSNTSDQIIAIGFHPDENASRSTSDSKLRSSRKTIPYQPYTIEDYRTLSVPVIDGSLGPDQVEVEKKRAWLMRRRSYGDTVSTRNRQNIVLYARKHKDVIAEHKPSEPRKDSNRGNGPSRSIRLSRPRKMSSIKTSSSSRRSKSVLEPSIRCLSKTSFSILEDPHLEALRQRHLNEKKMIDQLINKSFLLY